MRPAIIAGVSLVSSVCVANIVFIIEISIVFNPISFQTIQHFYLADIKYCMLQLICGVSLEERKDVESCLLRRPQYNMKAAMHMHSGLQSVKEHSLLRCCILLSRLCMVVLRKKLPPMIIESLF